MTPQEQPRRPPLVSDGTANKVVEEELRDVLDGLHDVRPRADDRRDKDIQRVHAFGDEDY